MPSLAAGASFNQVVSAGNSVRIQTTHNVSGRIRFVPASTELPPPPNSSRSFGPLPIDQTFGPWGMRGTVFIDCDAGSATTLTYDVNPDVITSATIDGTVIGGTTPANATVGNLTANGSFSAVGNANKSLTTGSTFNVTLGATGTGATTITRVNNFTVVNTDTSGTPGNATINGAGGRAAFAAAASTCVITNSNITAASKVFVSLAGGDATLTSVRVTPGAGTFTVTGNAAATATTVFDFFVVN